MKNHLFLFSLVVAILFNYSCEKNPTALEIPGHYKIAFLRCCQNIWIMDEEGGNQYKLVKNDEFEQLHQWSPDGKKIGFASNKEGQFEIFIADANGDNLKRLTNHPGYNSYSFCWSPDSKKIAYDSDENGNFEIYVVNVDGTDKKRLTFNSDDDYSPKWSSNGEKIVFNTEITSPQFSWEIFSVNPDGTGLKQLTHNPGFHSLYFDIAPDNSQLVYQSNKNGKRDLYIMDLQGGGEKQLTYSRRPNFPKWSPNGDKILFLELMDNYEIFTINPDGTNLHRLTDNKYEDISAEWSPDGKFIAFGSARDGNPDQIFIINSDGTQERQITFSDDWCTEPLWSPVITY